MPGTEGASVSAQGVVGEPDEDEPDTQEGDDQTESDEDPCDD